MKLSKQIQNAKLRKFGVLIVLMLSIGLIIYHFGSTLNDLDALLKSPIRTVMTNVNMPLQSSAIHSFWGECASNVASKNIPEDVWSRAEQIVLTEKTVSVDVSVKSKNIFGHVTN